MIYGCKDEVEVNLGMSLTADQKVTIEKLTKEYNESISVYHSLADGEESVQDFTVNSDGSYQILLNRGTFNILSGEDLDSDIPLLGIDDEGYWIYSLGGEQYPLFDTAGSKVAALKKTGKTVMVPQIGYDGSGKWTVSFDGKKWNFLSETVYKGIEKKDKNSFVLYKSISYDEESGIFNITPKVGVGSINNKIFSQGTALAWKKYLLDAEDNVLLDFSYAGYMHGEIAPPDVSTLGYTEVNIRDYMEPGSDYARDAFKRILKEYDMDTYQGNNKNVNLIIYFPEGDYIMHDERDNTFNPSKPAGSPTDSKGNNSSSRIEIYGGNYILKGAGRDKTRIIMKTPNLPETSAKYSCPPLFFMKNLGGLSKSSKVVKHVDKGEFSVEVTSALNYKAGDWVCLYLKDNSEELIQRELSPYKWEAQMTDIRDNGVQVYDYHQIKSVEGNVVTFIEPIMHEVDPKFNWTLNHYSHYENIGIEDLAFVGDTKEDYVHLESWEGDSGYSFFELIRTVNSWIRRVDFIDTSVCLSFMYSSNCSAYDINIKGKRGHSAVKSSGSSRVFIGKVTDRTNGRLHGTTTDENEVGQYHACGVSNESMGAVIWNVHWGLDACFESHASQPRATLIDNCKGGFHRFRTGGDHSLVPNHLDDLIIWNMNSERSEGGGSVPFNWWNSFKSAWKVMPPTIIGFHGDPIVFDESQVKYIESNGQKVEPESLYEAQLKLRLGEVPAWLKALK